MLYYSTYLAQYRLVYDGSLSCTTQSPPLQQLQVDLGTPARPNVLASTSVLKAPAPMYTAFCHGSASTSVASTIASSSAWTPSTSSELIVTSTTTARFHLQRCRSLSPLGRGAATRTNFVQLLPTILGTTIDGQCYLHIYSMFDRLFISFSPFFFAPSTLLSTDPRNVLES